MLKILLSFCLVFNLYAANTQSGIDASALPPEKQTLLKYPIYDILKTTQWDLFLSEFEIKFKVGECGSGLNYGLGFEAHMIEPLGYFENTIKPLNFPFAGLDLGGNIMKSGPSRSVNPDQAARDGFVWSHLIYAPIFGMIFKKELKVFCFHQGEIALPLLSEFLPPYQKDLMFINMIAPMALMFTPQGLMSTIFDCAATDSANVIHGYTDKSSGEYGGAISGTYDESERYQAPTSYDSQQTSRTSLKESGLNYLNFVRNSMYYSVGCLGFAPVGGYVEGNDPGTDTEMLLYQATNLLHGASAVLPNPFLYKQTSFTMDNSVSKLSIPDTMCKPQKYPVGIETQYLPQRAYPTVGKAHELGTSGVMSTTLANVTGSKDSFVNVVWERRDYYAFAYFCPDK